MLVTTTESSPSRQDSNSALRSTTNTHFSMSGLSLSRVEALKEVSVLPLPVVCQISNQPLFKRAWP
jgi:hypothetical protein